MRLVSEIVERLRSLLGRSREAREMAEEIRFHIERETEKNVAEGMSPREARRSAYRAFGGVERWTEAWREARGVGPIERWAREIRLAARRLLREPSLSVPALLTVALGVGATTSVFALVHATLIRPLPYPDAGRLVQLAHTAPALGVERAGQSFGTYAHYRSGNRVFEEVALYFENAVGVSATDGDVPERVRVAMVTPSFLSVLGVEPAIGRTFNEDEGYWEPGAPWGPVIISHDLWVRRYGEDPAVVGGTVELNRTVRAVVGVMPAGFAFPHLDTDVWYVSNEVPERAALGDLMWSAVARLRPGIDVASAEADLARLTRSLPEVYPDVEPEIVASDGVRPTVTPLAARMVEGVRRPLLFLALTASLVLMVTLANVAGLFLVRTERRRRELAVGRALGAGRADLVRRFVAEGLLLSILGGALGTAAAGAGVMARFGFAPGELPRLHELEFGVAAAAFAVALSVAVGLLVAGLSLVRSRRFGPGTGAFAAASRAVAGGDWQRVHRGLAAVQVALSLALLVGSAVMVRSLARLSQVEPGFEPGSALTFHVNPPATRYLPYARAATLYRDVREALLAVPGVLGVEAAARLPLTDAPDFWRERIGVVGADAPAEAQSAMLNLVTPRYFELMGIPLLMGTAFGDLSAATAAPPVVLSERLARQLFGDADPIGRRVRPSGFHPRYPAYRVAGVVGDVPGESLAEAFEATLYVPVVLEAGADTLITGAYPFVPGAMTVVVRAAVQPLGLVASAREIVRGLDPKLPVSDVRTLDDILAGATARLRLVVALLVLAAAAALGLGVTGVYGIVAYSVSQRTAEIGVRVALGATSRDIVRSVLTQTVGIALAGLAGGLLAAYALTRALRGQLYEIAPTDPAAFAAATALLLSTVLLAGWLPARRAGRLNAVEALRAE